MIEILCVSPLHILTAFALKYTVYIKDDVSILLLDYVNGAEVLYDKLRKSNAFHRIDFVSAKNIWNRYGVKQQKLFRMWFLIFGEKYLPKDFPFDDIKEFLFPYHDPFLSLISKEIKKRHVQCKFVYFDDGMATYVHLRHIIVMNPSKIEKLMGVPSNVFVPDMAYMYSPNCSDAKDYIPVKKIVLPQVEHFKKIINSFFEYSEYEHRKVVFFDQYCGEGESELDQKEIEMVLDFLDHNYNRNEIYIKKHPKRKDNIYESHGWEILPVPPSVPYEVCVLNEKDIDNMTLVTDNSTAVIYPKLIFGYEPKVIFLYKKLCVVDIESYPETDEFISKIEALYSEKEKITVL